jgi:ABC-2 type transport system permease protein
MKSQVTLHLILKDWRLNASVILLSVFGGVLALGVILIGGQTPLVMGAALFFISMIFCASFAPQSNVINERKKHTLPFLMSLPISPAQYGFAKLLSTLGMFLIPWVTLVATALYMILGRHILPNGAIPTALILSAVPFIGFCLITGTALVGESEGWATAAMAVVNSSYWIAWYLLASGAPSVTRNWSSPLAVWNRTAVTILAAEFAVIFLILVLTMLIQSRKHDFV